MTKAFTLIELLVVIGIIAILAAVLFPVFTEAKEAGKKVACMSNMGQISLAITMYANDWDDQIFFRSTTNVGETRAGVSTSGNALKWWNEIMPYVKSTKMFVCPDDPAPTINDDANGVPDIRRSYVAAAAAEDLVATQIQEPSSTVVITEKWSYDDNLPSNGANTASWMETFTGDMAPNPNNPSQTQQDPAGWHAGGVNSAFFDGHAKWYQALTITNDAYMSGCTLVHAYPTSEMCDQSYAGCMSPKTSFAAGNICDNPAFAPVYSNL